MPYVTTFAQRTKGMCDRFLGCGPPAQHFTCFEQGTLLVAGTNHAHRRVHLRFVQQKLCCCKAVQPTCLQQLIWKWIMFADADGQLASSIITCQISVS